MHLCFHPLQGSVIFDENGTRIGNTVFYQYVDTSKLFCLHTRTLIANII